VPSGGDGGNWLAVAHSRLGVDVLSNGVSYPPVFPGLVALLLLVLNPIPAIFVASIVSRMCLLLSVYLVMRRAGRVAASAAALVVGCAAFQLEAFAWGAYPQILAQCLGLICVYFGARFAIRDARRDAGIALVAGIATFATQPLVGGLLLLALPVSIVHAKWISNEYPGRWRPSLVLTALIVAIGTANLVIDITTGEGVSRLDPTSLPFAEAMEITIGEGFVPWAAVLIIGVMALLHRRWEGESWLPIVVSSGWFLAGVGAYFITGERRCLLAAQVAIVMLASSEVARAWRSDRRGVRTATALLAAALIGSIVITGIDAYGRTTAFYRIVDRDEIAALEVLEERARPGDVVIASRGRNTTPVGWWVEGIAGLPTFSGHDPRYLSFASEIAEAEAANAFFDNQMSEAESAEFLEESMARFIVVDRRGPDRAWLGRADLDEFVVIDDTSGFVILEVPSAPTQPA
jgi:hypothetical protein